MIQAFAAVGIAALLFVAGITAASIIPGQPEAPDAPVVGVQTAGAPAWTGYASAFGVMINGVALAFVAVSMRGINQHLRSK